MLIWRSEDPGFPHENFSPNYLTRGTSGYSSVSSRPHRHRSPPLTHLIRSPSSRFNFIVLKPFICTTDSKSCKRLHCWLCPRYKRRNLMSAVCITKVQSLVPMLKSEVPSTVLESPSVIAGSTRMCGLPNNSLLVSAGPHCRVWCDWWSRKNLEGSIVEKSRYFPEICL
jgi:hypothetical protein